MMKMKKMKESEAWAQAEYLAKVTRQATKIVRVTPALEQQTGQPYAFTLEGFPIAGAVVGVVVATKPGGIDKPLSND